VDGRLLRFIPPLFNRTFWFIEAAGFNLFETGQHLWRTKADRVNIDEHSTLDQPRARLIDATPILKRRISSPAVR
jgi:hypothetical protein